MATSGYALGNFGDFNGQTYVSWSLAAQGPNHSIVNWTYGLRFASGDGCHTVNLGHVKINEVTVYGVVQTVHSFSSGHNHIGDIQFASGQYQIDHDVNGNAQILLYGHSDGSQSGTPASTASASWALPGIPQLPGPPSTPTVAGHTDSDPTTATLSWTAPSNVGAGLSNAWLQISTDSNFPQVKIVDWQAGSWQTSYNATGLAKGTTYFARVVAGTSAGWGGWSNTLGFVTGTTLPSEPTGIANWNVGGSSADITWNGPGDNGGTAITGYELQRATNSSFNSGLVTTSLPGSAGSMQITGLTRTVTYYVRVRALNAVGSGGYSSTTSFTTLSSTPGQPSTPSVGSVTPVSASVSWTGPSDNGGSAVTSYDVQYALDPGFNGVPPVLTNASSPKVLANLIPSTQFYTRVRAVNANGPGAWGNFAGFRTPSGLLVGNDTAWTDTNVWIGDGSGWVQCQVHTGDGTGWR